MIKIKHRGSGFYASTKVRYVDDGTLRESFSKSSSIGFAVDPIPRELSQESKNPNTRKKLREKAKKRG